MMLGTFAVLTAAAGLWLAVDPASVREAMRPLLLLHGFASASGFVIPARRGHYDLLLTRGPGRVTVASVHAALSVAPGLAAWLALCAAETLMAVGGPPVVRTSGSGAAFVIVGVVAWSLTARLPRFAGAVGWLLVLAGLSAVPRGGVSVPRVSAATDRWLVEACGSVIEPERLLGAALSESQGGYAALCAAVAWGSFTVVRLRGVSLRLDMGQ
jgi:hypothetical protein